MSINRIETWSAESKSVHSSVIWKRQDSDYTAIVVRDLHTGCTTHIGTAFTIEDDCQCFGAVSISWSVEVVEGLASV
jgi:hypothetical protein